jgi:hypothetical protein
MSRSECTRTSVPSALCEAAAGSRVTSARCSVPSRALR